MPATTTTIEVGARQNATIEMRYDRVRQQTVFRSFMSGAPILVMADAEQYGVLDEYTALMTELQNHYGSRTILFQLFPPIQAAFNKLLNAVARYRLQMDSAR